MDKRDLDMLTLHHLIMSKHEEAKVERSCEIKPLLEVRPHLDEVTLVLLTILSACRFARVLLYDY